METTKTVQSERMLATGLFEALSNVVYGHAELRRVEAAQDAYDRENPPPKERTTFEDAWDYAAYRAANKAWAEGRSAIGSTAEAWSTRDQGAEKVAVLTGLEAGETITIGLPYEVQSHGEYGGFYEVTVGVTTLDNVYAEVKRVREEA